MVFRRRRKMRKSERLRSILWPKTGWKRSSKYILYRLLRLSAAPDAIAGGLAWGGAVSFTPFIGFHLIMAFSLARIFGHNVIAAVVGTMVGNPWTFPFIWALLYEIGTLLHPIQTPLPDWDHFTLSFVGEYFWQIFFPMLLASVPIAVVTWFSLFYGLRYLIPIMRRRLRKKSEKAGS